MFNWKWKGKWRFMAWHRIPAMPDQVSLQGGILATNDKSARLNNLTGVRRGCIEDRIQTCMLELEKRHSLIYALEYMLLWVSWRISTLLLPQPIPERVVCEKRDLGIPSLTNDSS